MICVGLVMLMGRKIEIVSDVRLTRDNAGAMLPKLGAVGTTVGAFAGFFGIGGGFLIVPGLILATAMSIELAVGTSLVAISAFGATTAASYATAGFIDWSIVGWMIVGSVPGAILGRLGVRHFGQQKDLLERLFASVVIAVGAFVIFTA